MLLNESVAEVDPLVVVVVELVEGHLFDLASLPDPDDFEPDLRDFDELASESGPELDPESEDIELEADPDNVEDDPVDEEDRDGEEALEDEELEDEELEDDDVAADPVDPATQRALLLDLPLLPASDIALLTAVEGLNLLERADICRFKAATASPSLTAIN